MAQWAKILSAVTFSVSATLLAMLAMSQFPGLQIPGPYWIFGIVCPALISAPVSVILVRQAEANQLLNRQLIAAQAALQQQADHDHLTGVLNRAAFYKNASQINAGGAACLLLADIDHFKMINDSHGHAAGDSALCVVANALASITRSGDYLGRVGGEEFAIYLHDVPVSTGIAVAERARAAVSDLRLLMDDGAIVSVSISIGVTEFAAGCSLEQALARADRAMYQAKRHGRNQVQIAA